MDKTAAMGITVKGIREGILIGVEQDSLPYSDLLEQLGAELTHRKGFLEGSRIVLDVGSRLLQAAELAQLQELFAENGMELWTVLAEPEETKDAARELGLATRLAGSNTDLNGNRLLHEDVQQETAPSVASRGSGGALLLRETLRSGQSVFHEGDVVIIGDVNPGAEVIAAGNVVVWGRLRGLVHAGALGDREAVICALQLAPTQLRIASQIAIPPEERPGTPVPEMASIRDNQIVADVWRTRD
jgi:septum site-determining protein MinC